MKTNTKIKPRFEFDINKNFLKDKALSSLLLNHSKKIVKEDYKKRFVGLELLITLFSCIALSATSALIFNPFFDLGFIDLFVLSYFASAIVLVLLMPLATMICLKTIFKKHKNCFKFIKINLFSFMNIKSAIDFDKKYNFEKIKKALDSHDFQSPDLSPLINDFFDFTQDDLKELNNDEIKLLFEKTKPYPKMANKVLKSIKKKKPIRKINARYFLEKTLKTKKDNNEIDISSINLEDYLSNELNGVLLNKSKKYMDII